MLPWQTIPPPPYPSLKIPFLHPGKAIHNRWPLTPSLSHSFTRLYALSLSLSIIRSFLFRSLSGFVFSKACEWKGLVKGVGKYTSPTHTHTHPSRIKILNQNLDYNPLHLLQKILITHTHTHTFSNLQSSVYTRTIIATFIIIVQHAPFPHQTLL